MEDSFVMFSGNKDQMELLQSFLMEPGYNLCVEWGFNTPNALSQMINTEKGIDEILDSIARRCLNQDNIHAARKSSNGEYDIFLGFIVGGNVVSDGETFILTVKCKGAPGLPTFLQTHKKTQEIDSTTGKIIEQPTVHPFPASELTTEGTDYNVLLAAIGWSRCSAVAEVCQIFARIWLATHRIDSRSGICQLSAARRNFGFRSASRLLGLHHQKFRAL